MERNSEKPTPEAKALSLFLMAYKTKDPKFKEKSKRINRLFDLVKRDEMDKEEYMEEVNGMLDANGGYDAVVEKTVQFYINKSGEWKLKGDDKYCQDAQKVADRIFAMRK